MARHSLDFWLTSEDLPDPENRVKLDSSGNIVLSYVPNNEEPHKQLIARLKRLMKSQRGCGSHGHECHQGLFGRNLYLGQRIPLAGVAHQNGTIRFGADPTASALDVNCKAHDLDNLYAILDHNTLQITGHTRDVMSNEPLDEKWRAFGWGVKVVNGHDYAALLRDDDEARKFAAFSVDIPVRTSDGRTIVERVLPYVSGRCQFLGEDDRCAIYDDRPHACRAFECVDAYNAEGVGCHGRFLSLNPHVCELLDAM